MPADGLALAAFVAKVVFASATLLAVGLGLAIVVGGALGARAERGAAAAAVGLAAMAYAAMIFMASARLGGGLGAAFDPVAFGWIWPARQLQAVTLAAGFAALLTGVFRRIRAAAGLGALLAASAFALSGHAAGLDAPGLAPAVVALHVLVAGFWASAPLLLWPRDDGENLSTFQAYSLLAVWTVPIVFAAGAYLALRIAGDPGALVETGYGRLLLLKLAVATAALGLGAINKTMITQRLRASPARGRRAMQVTLFIEAILFAAAICLIAWATTIQGPD